MSARANDASGFGWLLVGAGVGAVGLVVAAARWRARRSATPRAAADVTAEVGAAPASSAPPPARAPERSGLTGRVLVFGDSLTHRGADNGPLGYDVTEGVERNGSPGDLLASHLRELGASAVRINGRVGRSAVNFFRREHAEQIVADELARRPDLVIVFLGTNDLGLAARVDGAAFRRLRGVLGQGGAEFVAIGPPAFAAARANEAADVVYATLRDVFGAAHVVDFRALTADLTTDGRTRDGVHFTGAGARRAAPRLAAAVAEVVRRSASGARRAS